MTHRRVGRSLEKTGFSSTVSLRQRNGAAVTKRNVFSLFRMSQANGQKGAHRWCYLPSRVKHPPEVQFALLARVARNEAPPHGLQREALRVLDKDGDPGSRRNVVVWLEELSISPPLLGHTSRGGNLRFSNTTRHLDVKASAPRLSEAVAHTSCKLKQQENQNCEVAASGTRLPP